MKRVLPQAGCGTDYLVKGSIPAPSSYSAILDDAPGWVWGFLLLFYRRIGDRRSVSKGSERVESNSTLAEIRKKFKTNDSTCRFHVEPCFRPSRSPTRSLYLTNSRLTTEALRTSRPLSIDSMKVCPLSVRGPNMKYEKSAAAGWVWNRLFGKRFDPRPQLLFGDPR